MMKYIPFALPDIGWEENQEITECLKSGWLTTGPKAKAFEQSFSELLADNLATVAVNSGTAGLHLALEALGIGPGDEVITTTYTFTATAEVIRYLGAEPVLVDVEAGGFNMDPCAVETAITGRSKAIMPVHFAGEACRMKQIIDIAKRNGLAVVEDAAHALPARYDGRLIGTLDTDATIFSFYATKTLATGEGGMLVTRRADLARRARIMRLHGIDRDAFDRYRSERPAWYYEVVAPGFKYNMPDIAAAIGLAQLKKLTAMHQRRLEIALRYDEAFGDLPVALPPRPKRPGHHAWHLYPLRISEEAPMRRDQFIEEMSRRKVGTSVHFIPLHRHPYWRDRYGLKDEMFPNATAAYEQEVSLPIYSKMSDEDVERVVDAVREILFRGTQKR